MDVFGWFLANLHDALGHDQAAALMEMPPGNKLDCMLCLYHEGKATKEQVLEALAPKPSPE